MVAAAQPDDGLKEATSGEERGAKFWAQQIRTAGETEKDWRDDAERIRCRYRNETPHGRRLRNTSFPIFWSNVQTLKPNVYGQTPRPDVRRRHILEDPGQKKIGTEAATALERALKYEIDNSAFNEAMRNVRDDTLIVGRGVAREVYAFDEVRHTDLAPVNAMPQIGPLSTKADAQYTNKSPDEAVACKRCSMFRDGTCTAVEGKINPAGVCKFFEPMQYMRGAELVEPDGFDDAGLPYVDAVENKRTETRYVFWADFRMSPARCWSEVWWIAFRHAMDKDQLEKEFPDRDPKDIPKTLSAETEKNDTARAEHMPADVKSPFARAEVWEIWNKRAAERVWIATGYEDHILRTDPDPLRLEGFFPCPKPVYAIPTTDQMVPMPELAVYETLADELDEVQDRLRTLTKLAKACGITDGDFVEMRSIAQAKDGDFVPMKRTDVVAGDLRGHIWEWPLNTIVQAIATLTQRSEQLRQSIYELTGISDLRRGIGQERESATAQKLKASYGSVRMTPRSEPMAEFIRDLLRIKAEIMVEHFDPATLQLISGAVIDPAALALLQDERLRNTQIDIETDSTVAPDAEADKSDAVEFTQAITGYLTAAAQIGMASPVMIPLLVEVMRVAAQPFRFSRHIEEALDATAGQIAAAAAMQPTLPAPGVAPQGNGAAQPGMQMQ